MGLVISSIQEGLEQSDIQDLLDRVSLEQNVSILITDTDGGLLFKAGNSPNSIVFSLTQTELIEKMKTAEQNGGLYSEFVDASAQSDAAETGTLDKINYFGSQNSSHRLIFTSQYGVYVIFLDTSIRPPSIITDIIKGEMAYVAAIFLLLIIIMINILSKGVSKPIKRMRDEVLDLAFGNYDICFNIKGCSEILQLNSSLNHMVKQLSQLETMRQELIANISHDIRTPLAAIMGNCELMIDYPHERTAENIRSILDESAWLSELVSNMLKISKLRSTKDGLEITRFDLTNETEAILSRFQQLYNNEGFKIHFIYKQKAIVEADKMQISQVIYNFVNNAIKHSGADKTITVRQSYQDGEILMQIHNSGEGIAEDQLEYIWDRYYKGPNDRSDIGIGLGLSIVKSILEIHNSRFGVDSGKGDGSTFWFTMKPASSQSRYPLKHEPKPGRRK